MVFAPRLATLRSKRWDFQLSIWAAAGLPGSRTRPKRQMTENSNPRVDSFFALTSSAPFRLCSASSLCRPGYCEASSATCQLKVGYWQSRSPIEIMLCDLRTIPDELPSSCKADSECHFSEQYFCLRRDYGRRSSSRGKELAFFQRSKRSARCSKTSDFLACSKPISRNSAGNGFEMISNASLTELYKKPALPTYSRRSARMFATQTPTPAACASAIDTGQPTVPFLAAV